MIVTDLVIELIEGEKSDMNIPCRYNSGTCDFTGGHYCDPLCSGYKKLDNDIFDSVLF